ncbi:peptide chain release factor N(5)-glutamine methyltransferase [Bizionia sediminis]|uniref:Release factor glutamine methyltransferase n=1 Tax=Bizionia sediminis TaxID=1737064 RepID=A0ABW5KUJ7_9FLAO
MILKDIEHIFHQELDAIYGSEEVGSFFNLLIQHYLDLNRITLVLEPQLAVTKQEEQPLFEALSRLKQEEPIQYIIGETAFFGLQFKVTKDTLIPRPETEELVAWVLKTEGLATQTPLRVLDVGTGSGCIAISLATQLPQAEVYAVDISKKALEVARVNAQINKAPVVFVEADILQLHQPWLETKNGFFDVVVSNPPYVRQLEKAYMRNNVLNYEPHQALFVSNNKPLVFYEAIVQHAKQVLKPQGHLFFEINEYLATDMVNLLNNYGFKQVELKTDIFGKQRMLKGIR